MNQEACARSALCEAAMRTNRELRSRASDLERQLDAAHGFDVALLLKLRKANAAQLELRKRARELQRERDAAQAEANACRIYLWQRLPWKGYAS